MRVEEKKLAVSVAQFQLFLLALTRILALLVQLPVLGGPLIPTQVKLGLGILLATLLVPWQPLPADAAIIPWMAFPIYLLQELIIGTLVGFASRMVFATAQIAGDIMGIGSGFASAQIMNPTTGDTGSTVDQVVVMASMLLFLIINGHHYFLVAVQRTFVAVPLLTPLPAFRPEPLMRLTASLIATGVQLALPVMGALLLTDVALGLLARVAPQANPFFLGMPLKVGIGIIAIILALNILFPIMADQFRAIGDNMLRLMAS
jgi:flagellar biosynthesis protein FliR